MRHVESSVRPVEADGKREVIAICFQQFAPYHVDRIAAAHELLRDKMKVVGIEYSDRSTTYAWERAESDGFERITLFPSRDWEKISQVRRLFALLPCLLRLKADHIFLINYQLLDTFITAAILRLLGKSPYIMMASKYSDKDRFVWKESVKKWFFTPYVGGITSGDRHSRYLEFLGVRTTNFRTGLDTVSTHRVRAASGSEPAPGGCDYDRRHLTTIARLVPEKDVPTAVRAYARYRELCAERGLPARDLVLCGDGPERAAIEALIREMNIPSVVLLGFAGEKKVCETLASTLALILPSVSEPWGLVVNEAIAMGVPILCSNVCGALDELVHTGVNGFSFAPGEVRGLASLMLRVSSDKEEWTRLCYGSLQIARRGDTARFADALATVVQTRTGVPLVRDVQDAGGRLKRQPAVQLGFGRVLGGVD